MSWVRSLPRTLLTVSDHNEHPVRSSGLQTFTTVANGDSIASEGKGEYMYVEGRVLSVDGTPVPNATIDTWETDANGEG